jgi:glucosylceramidase
VFVSPDEQLQEITGFGGAFTEKGWQALETLPPAERSKALDAIFKPGAGTSLSVCRTPIGANDTSRKWYSYDEVDGDFALDHFTIDNDRETLIPFILAARERRADLKVWASPWSPPTWMKTNRYYAMADAWAGQPSNGIQPEQRGQEGHDYFVQEERYFDAYARYFRRYVEEYGKAGVPIVMVMPQNEFNSAQPFPSCVWTPEGLKRFIPHLGREMHAAGVDVFFGTLERGNPDLLTPVLKDPACAAIIKGLGVQWAGKGALEVIHERYPNLPLWSSEQECGIGTNDWHYARYSWTTMKRYFANGAAVWTYWNLVMPEGGMSGWGWPQNSLVTVDRAAGSFRLNHEYYLLRHLSQYVQPGAHRVPAESYFGYENQLAFRNPDGSIVIVVQNEMSEPLAIHFEVGPRQLSVTLPADSFNTLVMPAHELAI